jgi:hypothetical protein
MTPSSPFAHVDEDKTIPEFSLDGLTRTIQDVGAPLSPFHYQLKKVRPSPGQADERHGACRTWRRRYTNSFGPISMAG